MTKRPTDDNASQSQLAEKALAHAVTQLRRACHDVKGSISNASGFARLLVNSKSEELDESKRHWLKIIEQEQSTASKQLSLLSSYAGVLTRFNGKESDLNPIKLDFRAVLDKVFTQSQASVTSPQAKASAVKLSLNWQSDAPCFVLLDEADAQTLALHLRAYIKELINLSDEVQAAQGGEDYADKSQVCPCQVLSISHADHQSLSFELSMKAGASKHRPDSLRLSIIELILLSYEASLHLNEPQESDALSLSLHFDLPS